MPYVVDVSCSPNNPVLQKELVEKAHCYHTDKNSTIYFTNDPQDVVKVAEIIKKYTPASYIASIENHGSVIYYAPQVYAKLPMHVKKEYINRLKNLNQYDRTVHDYVTAMRGYGAI